MAFVLGRLFDQTIFLFGLGLTRMPTGVKLDLKNGFYSKKIISCILIVLAGISVAAAIHNAIFVKKSSVDFQWDSARVLLEKKNPYEIAFSNEKVESDSYVPHRLKPNQFPSCLMLLWPYALFSWPIAKWLWMLSNFLFTGLILFVLFKIFLKNRSPFIYLVISCLFLMSTPWRNLVGNGQHTLFSLCFFSLALLVLDKKPVLSGVFLALSFFKYASIFPLAIYFIYKRQFRPLFIALGIHLGLHLLAAYWINTNPIDLILEPLAVSAELLQEGYIDFFSLFAQMNTGISALVPAVLSGTLLLAASLICFLNKKSNDLLVLTMLGFVSVLVIYHRAYDLVILIFPLILLFESSMTDRWFKVLLILCVLLTGYFSRIVDFLQTRIPGDPFMAAFHTYYWIMAGIWILTTVCCLVLVGSKKSNR